MAKKTKGTTGTRLRRANPEREAPNRSANDHIQRNSQSPDDDVGDRRSKRPKNPVSDAVEKAISDVVKLSSNVIEEQIRAGQVAAERVRDGIAGSKQLSTDVNMLVENLVAATKDVGATWLDLLSIVARSISSTPPKSEQQRQSDPSEGRAGSGGTKAKTTTRTGTSGKAVTVSSITPADPASPGEPPEIIVKGTRTKSVTLDLRPPSIHFVPVVRSLQAGDPNQSLPAAQFELNADKTNLVLTVTVPRGQPAGTYAGIIVDSSSNEPGGTVSVAVGG
jgi:hypothetical protein